MNRTSLTRRLIAGAAGLMIGAAGAAALAAPAQATQGPHTRELVYSHVEFVDVCEGTYVYIKSGNVVPVYKWSITAGGELFWAEELQAGENTDLAPPLVPGDAGEISVDFKHSPNQSWPKTHTWTEPDDCGEPEPTPTPEPTPEPEPEPEGPLGEVEWEFDCETITLTLINLSEEDSTLSVVPSEGDAVEVTVAAGATAEPISFDAAEGLTVDLQIEGESVLDELIEITSEEWTELGCEEEPEGEGGELPTTGVSTGLIAGGAVLLLAIGGGLYLVARRRRVTFTAG